MLNFKKHIPSSQEESYLTPHLASIETAIQTRNQDGLLDAVYEIIKENSAVYTIGCQESDGRISLGTADLNGENYLILLTSPDHFRSDGVNSLVAFKNISQILDQIYRKSTKCGGLAINPFTDGYFLFKGQISSMIEAARKGTWGSGIPGYSQCDIMSQEDLQDFACETLIQNLFPERQITVKKIKHVAPKLTYIFTRENQVPVHIVVQAAVAPVKPTLAPQLRDKIIETAKRASAKCYYASLSFGSTDAKRFERSLALRGDSYYCSFSGLEEVN